jgi:SPP1 family predicted phage head-tail adaptor
MRPDVRLDRQITIERQVTRKDASFGTDIVDWQSITLNARLWAEVQDALPSRSEAVRHGLAVARNQTRIRMRWRNDIDSTMRVRVHGDGDDVIYSIVGGPAEIGGRKQFIEMVCERYSL